MTVTKTPAAKFTFTYEFADQLGVATISGDPVAISTPQDGGANLVKAGQVEDGTNVLVSWEGGEDGHDYLTVVTITASDGSVYEAGGTISVRAIVGEGVPGAQPRGRITLGEAKRQIKVELDDTERDEEIAGFIADAEGWIEDYTGHVIVARDVEQRFDGIGPLRLRAWPIKPDAVVAVSNLADDGTPVEVAGARLGQGDRPWRALAAFGTCWPWSASAEVIVTVRAGYEPGDDVPANLRRAMLVLIAGYDADREGGETFSRAEATARALAGSERLWSV